MPELHQNNTPDLPLKFEASLTQGRIVFGTNPDPIAIHRELISALHQVNLALEETNARLTKIEAVVFQPTILEETNDL